MKDFVHLCQPDACKSCGACCGLYNYTANDRESLACGCAGAATSFAAPSKARRISKRSPGRSSPGKTPPGSTTSSTAASTWAFWMKASKRSAACSILSRIRATICAMCHSTAGDLCDGHFCPSYHYISREEKLALINILDDWYLYGLCVTDIDLVKTYFRLVSERVFKMPSPDLFGQEPFRGIARAFFELKTRWPFQSKAANRFGKYAFNGREYIIPYIDYAAIGCEQSPFDKIFLSLSSEFSGPNDLRTGRRPYPASHRCLCLDISPALSCRLREDRQASKTIF